MTDRLWTDADLELVAGALYRRGTSGRGGTHAQRQAAAVLDALADAGRLAAPGEQARRLRHRVAELERERNSLHHRWTLRHGEAELLRARVSELEQTLASTRDQLRAEADRLIRRPAHPPTAPDTAWWLRRLAECPICSGPSRETTGMVCQACGKDWAAPPETAGGGQHD